jgi:hypothetical protein
VTHATTERPDEAVEKCIWCENARPFDMPAPLVRACLDGDLVVFAGAGVSTEQRTVLPFTFYEDIRAEVDVAPGVDLSFPEAMTAFEAAHDRMTLLERIKARLDNIKSLPNMDGEAGRFHSELSTIFTITDIFTTNWDDYFERNCAAQPFITEADWAFWKSSDRKVFKLHGSITSPGSVIATEDDYRRCYDELTEGLLGATLKTMLATKTVVFIGYSLRDDDFVRLYRLMQDRMREMLPRSYVITLDQTEPPEIARDMHLIHTSGVHFLHKLKEAFSEEELIPDERFDALPFVRTLVREVHHQMLDQGEMRDRPEMFICACYHDGLIDGFDHLMARKASGAFSHRCHTQSMIEDVYAPLQDERVLDGKWHDVAYIEGFLNALLFLLAEDEGRKAMPMYYVTDFDGDLASYDEYEAAAEKFEELNPEAYEWAKRSAAALAPGVVYQHSSSL